MKKLVILVVNVSCIIGWISSQVLKPSIGIGSLPADTASVCKIPYYLGSFAASGYNKGDTVPDFTLYNLNGQPFNLLGKLQSKKPVLLIGGNYTCMVYRDKVASINYMQATYGNQVQIVVIYGVEAHPLDTSPYFAKINTSQRNYDDSVLYFQPKTYGARKSIASEMIAGTGVSVPVYLDGPCNEWWLNYGPAPNNAYLIDTNGRVFAKHDWYNKLPNNDIEKDVRKILGLPVSGGGTSNGRFTISVIDSMGEGNAGDVIDATLKIYNPDTASVLIDMARMQQNLPAGWLSSMCTNICYDPAENRDTIFLAAGDSILFYMHFYTTASTIRDSGNVLMGFRNIVKTNNMYQIRLYALANPSVTGTEEIIQDKQFIAFPNPFNNYISITGLKDKKEILIELFEMSGRKLLQTESDQLNTSQLEKGMFILKVNSEMKLMIKN